MSVWLKAVQWVVSLGRWMVVVLDNRKAGKMVEWLARRLVGQKVVCLVEQWVVHLDVLSVDSLVVL